MIDKQKINITLHKQLRELNDWFTWYDTQTVQYERDMRLYGKSSINIQELDFQAVENAKTIKTLRLELEELRKK